MFRRSRGLRRRSTAARLLRSWVRIPPGAWMFVCCDCCVLSGRGLCDELITRPEESYRLCGASLCVIKKSRMRGGYSPARSLQNTNPQWVVAPVGKKDNMFRSTGDHHQVYNELKMQRAIHFFSTQWDPIVFTFPYKRR